jgi:hypothetical protein
MAAKLVHDIEESEEDLESDVGQSVKFWEKKQKELITSTVDYNLSSLADLINAGRIRLAPKYQRRLRWTEQKQSALIESFLMNVPVPPIYLNEDEYGTYSVIDGKQRLSSIQRLFSDELRLTGLSVFSDINQKTHSQLPRELRTILATRPTIRAVIILRQSDRDIKNEVFHRLNTGGTALNAQEIRNNAFAGPLNDLIMELAESARFHGLLNIKKKETSKIYQEMRDAELVLRFFAFRNDWRTFNGGMKLWMDGFMSDHRGEKPKILENWRREFEKTLQVVETCFGSTPFRRWEPAKKSWRKQTLAALYDAQMFACREFGVSDFAGKHERIDRDFKKLFADTEFRRSIDAATNTPSFFKYRIERVLGVLEKIG